MSTFPERALESATITKRLKTADPTIVPTPTSDSFVAAANEVKSSGADDPAAIKVAPATSSERFNVYSNVFKQMLRIGTVLKAVNSSKTKQLVEK